jgi:hypothetical protein
MEVIPISAPDSISVFRNMRVRTFFVVDDRLDEAKLREALTRLIRDHWRKLGARIITHKNKGAVYHLPKVFDDGYELFRWSANHSDSLLDDAAAQINFKTARLDGGVAVFPSVDVCDALFRPQQWPFTFDAEPDAPMLLIHLSLFSDATVIAISHPHMLGDQLGLANIIKAWLGLLEDRIPPPMLGHNDDILPGQKPFSQYPKSETFKKGQYHVRRPFERVGVLLPFIWELTTEPKEEKATLFFPAPLIQSLRERHTGILAEKRGTSLELTNGDFVSAILLKARPSSPKLPLSCRPNIPARSSPVSPRKRSPTSPFLKLSTSAAASPPSLPRSPKQAISITDSSTPPRASATTTPWPFPRSPASSAPASRRSPATQPPSTSDAP